MQSASALIQKFGLINPREKTIVGVSGGRDSVALAHFLHSKGFSIAIAHVNYQLRGDESDLDEEFVRKIATLLNVPCFVKRAEKSEGTNTQIWARNVRYSFFTGICSEHGYQKIATAHHASDSIETMLINLCRGTGISGLAGIPHLRENIVRPLLETTSEEIDDYILTNNLQFREDSSNTSTDYLRNVIRNSVLPILKKHDSDVLSKLTTSNNNLRNDAKAIAEISAALMTNTPEGQSISIKQIPKASRSTILYHSLAKFGFNRVQCTNISEAAIGSIIEADEFIAVKSEESINVLVKKYDPIEVAISTEGLYHSNRQNLAVAQHAYLPDKLPKSPTHVWLDSHKVAFPLVWKTVEPTLRFKPLGADYHVSVNQYLKDKGIDQKTRKRMTVVIDSKDEIIWIPEIQLADQAKCTDKTNRVISLNFSRT